jgi:hypothetical protein
LLQDRRRQDHQNELERKAGLVTEISESVLDIVLAVRFEEAGAATQMPEQYDTRRTGPGKKES